MAESFERVEQKYLLDADKINALKKELNKYVSPSTNNNYQIMSLYFDNNNFDLISRSIEKPKFKEKLRIRSYSPPGDNDDVFVEIKRKYDGVVYKRRTSAKYGELICNINNCEFKDSQITNEIKYFLNKYGKLEPKIYVSCFRKCYVGNEDKNLRITFDENIRYRTCDLYLKENKHDKPLMDKVVMEIKIENAMPLWLSEILNRLKIYPESNSKVGKAYMKEEGMLYGII